MESSVTKVQVGILKSSALIQPDMTIEESLSLPNFCLHKTDDKVSLKKSHAYYFQVQGQLMTTGVTYCDFLYRCLDVDFMKELGSNLSEIYFCYFHN